MVNRSRSYLDWKILLLFLVFGGIIGGWIGEAVVKLWPALSNLGQMQSVGLPNFTLDLEVFTLTFGFMLHINFFTILGFALAYFIYRRL